MILRGVQLAKAVNEMRSPRTVARYELRLFTDRHLTWQIVPEVPIWTEAFSVLKKKLRPY